MTGKLRYARGGPDLTGEQRTWALRHPLYMLGDVVMVYVNEGDLYQFGEEVTGEFVKDDPFPFVMPIRIQLKRTKGWQMPPNTVKVDRSTPWGNPWPIGEYGPLERKAIDAEGAVGFFEQMFTDPQMKAAAGYPDGLGLLAGKNLACWCPLGQPCHADVLLRIVNRQSSREPHSL